MFKFLIFIFFFGFILVSLLGFSVLRTIKSFFFGDPRTTKSRTQTRSAGQQRTQSAGDKKSSRKKIIPKEEGEYIDYEEVKE
jgi:hypothetical protein